MIDKRFPSLDELAFEGRNKAYGAYDQRRKYSRNLLISLGIGVLFISLAVGIPWLYFSLEPVLLVEGDMMYDVAYYDMSAPPDMDASKLAQAMAKPVAEQPQVPVVTDSVKPEEQKPVEDPPEKKKEVENLKTDSLAKAGGSGLGEGTGLEAGLTSVIDVYPRFPGGDESRLYYLRQHTRYPEAAMKNLVQGTVMVVFIVELDGSLSNVKVTQKIGGGCDEEAIRVTREMPRWEPGKRNGRAVRVMVRMPIVFRMPGGRTGPK